MMSGAVSLSAPDTEETPPAVPVSSTCSRRVAFSPIFSANTSYVSAGKYGIDCEFKNGG
jgi:hypothetical protein